ncbi:MarR family winged helix-turn-helix transcriptional regulator, partial [Streptomyces sp. NPDC002143]
PAFNEEEASSPGGSGTRSAAASRKACVKWVLQVEELGEERRLTLLDGQPPTQRRSGRRPQI